MTLPATVPTLDWSSWTSLENLLRQKYRTVRTLTDPAMPGAAIATWEYSPAGTLSYTLISPSGGGLYAPTLTTAASSGAAAVLRPANAPGASSQLYVAPNTVGALAITMEGLRLNGGGGFDFQIGFPGSASTTGGCAFWELNGEQLGEIQTFDASTNKSRTPRSFSDAVTNGTTTLTSATATFVSADVGQPIGSTGNLIPGTVIASVTNSTTVILSLPALTSASGQTIAIGQQPNVNVLSSQYGFMNLSFIWWTQDGYAWVMQDDQVLAEINLGAAQYYSTSPAVIAQVQIISRDGAAHSMSWDQARFSIASNGN